MNHYLDAVGKALTGIPEDDKADLLAIHEEKFLDEDMDDEEKLVEKYGKPKTFARQLKMRYFVYQDEAPQDSATPPETDAEGYHYTPQRHRVATLVGVILLGIAASPVLLPTASILIFFILFLFGLLLFALLLLYFGDLALIGLGGIAIVAGFAVIGQSVPTTLLFVGTGLALGALGVFLAPWLIQLTRWLVGLFVKLIKKIARRVLRRQGIEKGEIV
ncbi:MAG: DUF1700 domain-containing protein [Streptococcaceae bacterium]|jgi:uncharacterized membrane protein|nr:DUF1700 domain-containing protein [Streptococcaceae bacterium]